jgi:hypothetical protein
MFLVLKMMVSTNIFDLVSVTFCLSNCMYVIATVNGGNVEDTHKDLQLGKLGSFAATSAL